MYKRILFTSIFFTISLFAKSQTDTICPLIIKASSDSIIYKELSTIDSTDPKVFIHKIIIEKAIIYLQIDSIIRGDYSSKNIVVETEPIIRHMRTEYIKRGIGKTQFLSGVHRKKYNNYIFRLRKINDVYIICKDELVIFHS